MRCRLGDARPTENRLTVLAEARAFQQEGSHVLFCLLDRHVPRMALDLHRKAPVAQQRLGRRRAAIASARREVLSNELDESRPVNEVYWGRTGTHGRLRFSGETR